MAAFRSGFAGSRLHGGGEGVDERRAAVRIDGVVSAVVGQHNGVQLVAFGQTGRHGQHNAVAERHDRGLHILVIIVSVGYGFCALEQSALEVLVHEVQRNDQVLDAQSFAVHDSTLALTAVLGAAVVKGDGQCYLVLILIEHGRRVHATRSNDYSVFHVNRYGNC